MELQLLRALGDQLAATGVLREWKRENPDENVRIWNATRPEIWRGNPHLGRGNRENGKRVSLIQLPDGRLTHYYAGCLIQATGRYFAMQDDSPEIHLTDEERATDFGFEVAAKSVVIDPWAGWETRRWPHVNFQRVAKTLARQGWQVLELGGGTNRPMPLPMARDLHGKTTVREAAVLLSRAALYVGNDSGLMHLAAAVGTPQVVVYGSVPSRFRAYRTTLGIDPPTTCDLRCQNSATYCARRVNRKPGCMDDVTVERVLEAIEKR